MLAVFLGLREGAGATVCCASAAREASLYRQPVLAIDGRHSDAGLSSLFNRTDGDGEDWLGALRGGRKACPLYGSTARVCFFCRSTRQNPRPHRLRARKSPEYF